MNGEQVRAGVELHLGDCREVLAGMPEASVDAVVCDPPYELNFMSRSWDNAGVAFDPATWTAALRVAKPGAHLLAFGGTRTFHRMTVAIEDAGWEIRDCLSWLYGSGFSKSWNFATMYQGGWCECGGDALPYNHAGDADMHGLRGDVHTPTVSRETGQDPDLLTAMQWREPGSGVGDARPQGSGGVVGRGPMVGSGQDEWQPEPGVAGGELHRAGQGLSDGEDAGPSEGSGERIRGRASASDGGDDRPSGGAPGGGSPHQRGPSGQPAGEPEALCGSHEPLDDRALRGGPVCSRCGGLSRFYRGAGTGLKPAWEPIVLARKPLDGTVAANVLEHGTGALNIDGCRLPTDDRFGGGAKATSGFVDGYEHDGWTPGNDKGRWPPNVALDEVAAAMLDQQSGERSSGKMQPTHTTAGVKGRGVYGADAAGGFTTMETYGDTGGASRFLYCAKAGRDERPWQQGQVGKERCSTCGGWEYGNPACECDTPTWERNDEDGTHPTVKPLALMRWLVRMVAPPGGIVLDPFAGTGTTAEAALLEGFEAVLIEKHEPYLALIRQRLSKDLQVVLPWA